MGQEAHLPEGSQYNNIVLADLAPFLVMLAKYVLFDLHEHDVYIEVLNVLSGMTLKYSAAFSEDGFEAMKWLAARKKTYWFFINMKYCCACGSDPLGKDVSAT